MCKYKQLRLRSVATFMAAIVIVSFAQANVVNFEDLSLPAASYWNGSDGAGGFASGIAHFNNSYASGTGWEFWDGFAYSNITDTAASGMAGQYNAIAGGGEEGSANYALGWVGWAAAPTMTLNSPAVVQSLYVTNNNYSYYSMLNGDMFAKKFGGTTGDDPDWFMLTITGKNSAGDVVGATDFYLADYRFADNTQDYILNTWEKIDLTGMGPVKNLEFTLSSSDAGQFGMNTPAYFALDSISVIPAPATLLLGGIGVGLVGWGRRRKIL